MLNSRALMLPLTMVIAVFSGCESAPETLNDGYGEYVLVPAGEFLMGDNFDEGNSDEIPVHSVLLDSYYIGKYKVTNADYRRFIETGGYQVERFWQGGGFGEHGGEPDHWYESEYYGGGTAGSGEYPVVGVSWFEAAAYCSWLSDETGASYRLPIEAEWEKAARGTEQRRYPWGNEIDNSYASYDGGEDRDSLRLAPVGFFDGSNHAGRATHDNSSPYGAYDMAGNTSEWCSDWYDRAYYAHSAVANPTGPDSGTSRVLRGGGYVDSGFYQRSAGRHKLGAHFKSYKASFRCVREP